jgi:hypothetical protein
LEEIKVKESKTNQNSSKQRDPWAMVQSQLGLLSSPIEQEQVSVVKAADPHESSSDNHDVPGEVPESEIPFPRQESETVAVNIFMPTASEKEGGAWNASPCQDADDLFGFNPLSDCDIPKNAFAAPKKPKSFQKAETFTSVPVEVPSQDVTEKQDVARLPGVESGEGKTLIDPLLSDELPTSLWKPRKPAPIAKTQAETPSFSDNMSGRAEGKTKEDWKQDADQPPVDDLARHSSSKRQHERSNDRQEKFADRKPREPLRESPDRDRREHPRSTPDNQKYRPPKTTAPQTSLDDFVNDPVDILESSFDDLAWEPKQASQGRDRKPGKSFRQTDVPSSAFADRDDEPERLGTNLDRRNDVENDWFDDSAEIEQVPQRATRKDRQRKSSSEKKRKEPEKDMRSTHDAEANPSRHARKEREFREERELSSRQPAVPKRGETPATGKAAGVPSQKIAVSSWDDAVRDIIEKNMQRRPVTTSKPERRNGGGRSFRR